MKKVEQVPGLFIQEDVIDEDVEKEVIGWLDRREWSTALPRRTQHFGYLYGYANTDLTPGDAFEGWITKISTWLTDNKVMGEIDQCIVNEYDKDQKIGKHIDGKRGNRSNIFGPRIVSISLGEDTNFIFCKGYEKVEIHVPRRSMIVMTEDSRYEWTHEIPKRNFVKIDGKCVAKGDNYRRISLTFRKTL